MYNISKSTYCQLIKKPEVIRLSKGGYVIPLPFIPYKFNPEDMTLNEFFKMIEWDLAKFINFVIFHFRRPNSSFGMTDEQLYMFVLDGFKRRFVSRVKPMFEELEFLKKVFNDRLNHYNRVGYYVFEAWVRKHYSDVFVGDKAQFHCVKRYIDDPRKRAGLAHHAHKVSKMGILLDIFICMGKNSLRRYFKSRKVAFDKQLLGEKKCNFRHHDELMARANRQYRKYGLKEIKRSQFRVYLKELLEELGMTVARFLKVLRNGWLDVDINLVEKIYNILYTARISRGVETRFNMINRHLKKFLGATCSDVGWDCCDFY